jgi:hypothetical protein
LGVEYFDYVPPFPPHGDFNDHQHPEDMNWMNQNMPPNDTDDILILAGPLTLDLLHDTASFGNVSIYPGTYRRVEFNFVSSDDIVFNGNSIIVKGVYTNAEGTAIPVILKSNFERKVHLPIANGGVTVGSDSSVTISIIIDAIQIMRRLDLSKAVVSNGQILIDYNNNINLLMMFNDNISDRIHSRHRR